MLLDVRKSATENQRRNAMQQFIAKFEKEILGVLSSTAWILNSAGCMHGFRPGFLSALTFASMAGNG
jgi:hypothetical protein